MLAQDPFGCSQGVCTFSGVLRLTDDLVYTNGQIDKLVFDNAQVTCKDGVACSIKIKLYRENSEIELKNTSLLRANKIVIDSPKTSLKIDSSSVSVSGSSKETAGTDNSFPPKRGANMVGDGGHCESDL